MPARTPALIVLLIWLLVPSWTGEERLPLLGKHPAITMQPVALHSADPLRRRLGALTYLGGVRLNSSDPAFGGFSAMLVDGERFTLLSDGGNIVRFRLDRFWKLSEIDFAELPAGPGRGWSKLERDTEAMSRDPVTGRMWVAFERANQIWRYDPMLRRSSGHVMPPAMAAWPKNSGAESLLRLADGSFLVLAEGEPAGRGAFVGLRFADDPVAHPPPSFRFGYRPPPGFRPTDMAELPDGRLLVLNRSISLPALFTAKLVLLERGSILPGRIAKGQVIAHFSGEVLHDNFESLAIIREGDSTIVWIASDDNRAWFQRSLLLKFRLDLPQRQTPAP